MSMENDRGRDRVDEPTGRHNQGGQTYQHDEKEYEGR